MNKIDQIRELLLNHATNNNVLFGITVDEVISKIEQLDDEFINNINDVEKFVDYLYKILSIMWYPYYADDLLKKLIQYHD